MDIWQNVNPVYICKQNILHLGVHEIVSGTRLEESHINSLALPSQSFLMLKYCATQHKKMVVLGSRESEYNVFSILKCAKNSKYPERQNGKRTCSNKTKNHNYEGNWISLSCSVIDTHFQ